jgi:hypothetical protein
MNEDIIRIAKDGTKRDLSCLSERRVRRYV